MLAIGQRDIRDLLTMEACIEVMESALTDLANGHSTQQLRSMSRLSGDHAFAVMPAYLANRERMGAKIISVFPDNYHRGLPSHQGVVALFDSTTGVVKAILDAQSITAIRTAATSAVATKALANVNASVLGMIGTGEQARSHLEAMLLARPIACVKAWGPSRDNLVGFRDEMMERFEVPILLCTSAQDAVGDADIICTVTASKVPVVMGEWVKPGVHVNAVGACRPTERELDTALVTQSRFYVDSVESVTHESGDYLFPLQAGAIGRGHILGELGDLLLGNIPGRTSGTSVTVFKSLGIAVEDLAAADYVFREAVRLGRGTAVDLT